MSKFLNLLNKYNSILNEEAPIDAAPENQVDATQQAPVDATPPIDQNTSSELRVATNKQIAELANSLKIFYSQDEPILDEDDINEIKSLNPEGTKSDADILEIIKTLTNIFSPNKLTTTPQSVPNSNLTQ